MFSGLPISLSCGSVRSLLVIFLIFRRWVICRGVRSLQVCSFSLFHVIHIPGLFIIPIFILRITALFGNLFLRITGLFIIPIFIIHISLFQVLLFPGLFRIFILVFIVEFILVFIFVFILVFIFVFILVFIFVFILVFIFVFILEFFFVG